MLLSQDEARFPMVPTLQATLGVKGHRLKVLGSISTRGRQTPGRNGAPGHACVWNTSRPSAETTSRTLALKSP